MEGGYLCTRMFRAKPRAKLSYCIMQYLFFALEFSLNPFFNTLHCTWLYKEKMYVLLLVLSVSLYLLSCMLNEVLSRTPTPASSHLRDVTVIGLITGEDKTLYRMADQVAWYQNIKLPEWQRKPKKDINLDP